jgi:hypothetical protein
MKKTHGGKRPGAGRKPIDNSMDELIFVRIDRATRAAIEHLSSDSRQSMSAWCRAALLCAINDSRKDRP